jgi:ArsR family transcriptional regulator
MNRAAELFRAMGDPPRLRLLEMLSRGPCCVSEIVQSSGDKFSTVSQRLRVLRDQRLILRRREGSHIYYSLADRHVADLIHNALEHAAEPSAAAASEGTEEGV